MTNNLRRVCVKLFAAEPEGARDEILVPVFHELIRERKLDMVFIDVADYTHVPESPGVMLVTHDASFSLDRADGRLGLLAQRRRPVEANAIDAIAGTWRDALRVVAHLESDSRLKGRLVFNRTNVRFEANDRLRAPNTAETFLALEPLVRAATESVYPNRSVTISRVAADPRDRLALEVKIL